MSLPLLDIPWEQCVDEPLWMFVLELCHHSEIYVESSQTEYVIHTKRL